MRQTLRHVAVGILTGPVGRISGFVLEVAITSGSHLRARMLDGR
jgi:hypothetical protein